MLLQTLALLIITLALGYYTGRSHINYVAADILGHLAKHYLRQKTKAC